jgi:malate dehydrogenase (oxaloacetate-decarboxylating)
VTDDELNANYIIPSVFHADVHGAVAASVRHAAERSGSVADVPTGVHT